MYDVFIFLFFTVTGSVPSLCCVSLCCQLLWRVGDVLHYVWGEPQGLYPGCLVCGKYVQGFLHGFDTVIDSRQYVGVVVGGTLQDTACCYCCFFTEEKHGSIS